ncbi:MAG: hypothetical protein QXP70_06700, partial [Methanomassiliicoccales archaeon]
EYPLISAGGYIGWWGDNWLPINYHSLMSWENYKWQGQQLFRWGPEDSSTIPGPVSFSFFTSNPASVFNVSYNAGAGITYRDVSNPQTGNASAVQTVFGSQWGRSYTVSPVSVGLLNPTKAGGNLPMISYSYFGVDNDISTLQASWQVALFTTPSAAF